ncbi:MAG: tryptophan synthase subunit alpha [Candidatus Omnitrophota bacterium]
MNRIDKKFKELRKNRKKAFIAFLTAGYPDLSTTEKLVLEFEKNGADIIELGVPFSDPIADGPVIQMSSYAALKKGVTLKKILSSVSRLRRKSAIPLAAMSYFNPILHYGLSRFIKDAVKAGLDAVIVPDLPPEEENDFFKEALNAGLYVIRFIAPTTSRARARYITATARGFIYFVSLTGVTGARMSLQEGLRSQLSSVKKTAGFTPVCAGFGVSTPAQARLVSSMCDGVIVGSAIVKMISKHIGRPGLVSAAGAFVKKMKG